MKTEAKRRFYIDTAMRMFLEKGYDQVSVNDICQRLRITKPTFYHYVEAKEMVLVQYFDEVQETVIDRIEPMVRKGEFLDALITGLTVYHEPAIRLGYDLFSVYIRSMLVEEGSTWRNDPRLQELMVACIDELQQQGLISNSADPEQLYYTLVHLDQGLCISWCAEQGGFDLAAAFYDSLASMLGLDETQLKHPAASRDAALSKQEYSNG